MLVVPVKGDRVLTRDYSDPVTVSSYTNLKSAPSLYVRGVDIKGTTVELSDVVELNGVKVAFHRDSKVLEALGPLRRRYNLPQPGDRVTIRLVNLPTDAKQVTEEVEVKSLRLHDKAKGLSRGLLICSTDACYTIKELLEIHRKVGSEPFDPKAFQSYYLDYLPYSGGSK